jgi:hypothetical protein
MNDLFNTGIRPVIDGFLAKKALEERNYGDYWSASSAGYCMRKVIFERLGIPKIEQDGDERKTRVFESGHIFHEWVQRITKESGLSIAQEVRLQDEKLMIRGHIDDLIRIQLDESGEPVTINSEARGEHLILYDYKTQHSRAFHWSKGRPMSHYHRMQLGTYMYMLRKEHPKLKEARILKISKDDLCMVEQQLLWASDLEKDVVGYWKTLNGYWRDKKIPRCTCGEYEVNQKTGVGFMADPKYNGYFYDGEPCSLEYAKQFKDLFDKWGDNAL